MPALLDVQYEVEGDLPSNDQFQQWVDICITKDSHPEICIRIVSPEESQQLNHQYRGKDKPTNVLSFPFEAPPGITVNILGDLVVCAEVVANEAEQQNKALFDHWAHMIVHGCLHLLGYDHINDQEAEEMEDLERSILSNLAIDDPYREV